MTDDEALEAIDDLTEAVHRLTDVMDGIRKDIAKLVESEVGK